MDSPQDIAAATAATVKAELGEQGITLAQAARDTGIPFSTLHRRLRGTPPGFSVTELSSLASLLGMDVSDLLRQPETPTAA